MRERTEAELEAMRVAISRQLRLSGSTADLEKQMRILPKLTAEPLAAAESAHWVNEPIGPAKPVIRRAK